MLSDRYVAPMALPIDFWQVSLATFCKDIGFEGFIAWRDGRVAEGAPLLREYGVDSSIEGSNPSLSAILKRFLA